MGLNVFGIAAALDMFQDVQDAVQPAVWEVGTNVEYALYVEFGTEEHEAYPYLRPGIARAEKRFDELADKADDTDELVKLVALAIEEETKKHMKRVESSTDVAWRPGGHLIDTSTLIGSIEAEKIQ